MYLISKTQACLQIETPEYVSEINMPLSNCLNINKIVRH